MFNALLDFLKRLVSGPPRPEPGTSPFPPGSGPARVLIMRHAEKTGKKSDPGLSTAGHERARRLASYIPQTFGTPDFLVAASTSQKSSRPVETLEPLADALSLPIIARLDDDENDALVEQLRASPQYAGRFGVIAWRHANLTALIAALGAPDGSYPSNWDDAVYNVIIEISYRDGSAPVVRQIVEPF